MTTAWLLLLLLIVSSQSVDSQLTTDDQVCDGQQFSDMKPEIQTLLHNQQRIFRRLGKPRAYQNSRKKLNILEKLLGEKFQFFNP